MVEEFACQPWLAKLHNWNNVTMYVQFRKFGASVCLQAAVLFTLKIGLKRYWNRNRILILRFQGKIFSSKPVWLFSKNVELKLNLCEEVFFFTPLALFALSNYSVELTQKKMSVKLPSCINFSLKKSNPTSDFFDPIVYCKMALTTFVKQAAFGVLHNKRGGLMDAFNQARKLKIENQT